MIRISANHTLVLSLLLTLMAWSCRAAASAEIVDPQAVVLDLQSSYQERAIDERMTVTAWRDGRRRQDTVLARFRAPDGLQLELGRVIVWVRDGAMYAVHRSDASTYFVSPHSDQSPRNIVCDQLPPLPLPQLGFAWPDRSTDNDPSQYFSKIQWNSASLLRESSPPVAVLEGSNDRFDIRLEMLIRTGTLRSALLQAHEEDVRIEIEVESISPDRTALGIDLESRVKVISLADLQPRPGDLVPGRMLPDLPLAPINSDQTVPGRSRPSPGLPEDEQGPGVLLLLTEWTPSAEAALDAANQVLRSMDSSWLRVGVVVDLGAHKTPLQERFATLSEAVRPHRLHYSVSSAQTIDRFVPSAPGVLVAMDASGRITLVENLDSIAGDPAGAEQTNRDALIRRIRAALAGRIDEREGASD